MRKEMNRVQKKAYQIKYILNCGLKASKFWSAKKVEDAFNSAKKSSAKVRARQKYNSRYDNDSVKLHNIGEYKDMILKNWKKQLTGERAWESRRKLALSKK